jgi:hypothetical protein
MATANISYASQVNARYSVNTSNFIGLAQRINDTVANMQAQGQRNWHANLATAIKTFKKNHPKITTYSNRSAFALCQAQEVCLNDIVIDTTMQREPDLNWVIKIITNFRAYQAQPIQVYATGDQWGGWDGQHTAIALYLIAVHAFGVDPATETVPANIYAITNRGQLRGNFINNNTTVGKNAGKKPLDLIDIIQQMIFGVLVDGVTDPEWVDMAAKQKILSEAGLFMTAEKFGDAGMPGAISRVEELKDASVSVVQQFAHYGKFIVDTQQRAIDTKEIPIIIEFLNMAERDQIVYTEAEMADLALNLINWFVANFDAKGPYWEQVYQANLNAYNTRNQSLPKHLWPDAPKNLKNVPVGTTFFWYQLRKSWSVAQQPGRFPKNSFNVFVPAEGDLW